ncbi:MAG: CoA pyrophosphatase [Tatlockia sp.]|nr:CoA pyrophosphatase [Tatlockia sp.]
MVQFKKAAVLVLHELQSNSIILTQRSPNLRSHPGEVCFPGGSWQKADLNLYATALRELEEELGIGASRISLQNELSAEPTLSGFTIYPWLASIENLHPYNPDLKEVSAVFLLPLHEVINPANYKIIKFERPGLTVETYQFTASKFNVWGVTANIMRQLINLK